METILLLLHFILKKNKDLSIYFQKTKNLFLFLFFLLEGGSKLAITPFFLQAQQLHQ